MRGSRPLTRSLVVGWVITCLALEACSREQPPGALEPGSRVSVLPSVALPPGPSVRAATPPASSPAASGSPDPLDKVLEALDDAGAPPVNPADGPMVGVSAAQGQVFSGPASTRETRIGYIRRGGRVALLDPTPVKGKHCDEGWYRLRPVGYVCGKYATTDLANPQVRFGVKEPAFDEPLPYRYGSNVAHGTPLYRTVPSRDEMAAYEPYLNLGGDRRREERTASADAPPKKKSKKRRGRGKRGREAAPPEPAEHDRVDEGNHDDDHEGDRDGGAPSNASASSASGADAGAPPPAPAASTASGDAADAGAPDAGDDESSKPWFMRKYEPGKHPDIKLSDLTEGADKVLARRMAKGFYVAVDRTFVSNGRSWHKTTAGQIAPADRVALVRPNTFHGIEIDEAHANKPVAFVMLKSVSRYQLDEARKAAKPAGTLARYDRVFLTGQSTTVGGRSYRETEEGHWLRESDIAFTEPGAAPSSLRPGEKWVDVNLSRQTLVAFEGSRPVYATLVSTGRKGKDKAHDHTTPKGMWRVREKHVAATMDGDGAAAGDLPYSIEDVPYVLYFHESYALHGAFWHDNFGRQQSHGCVNLAPLDAKRIFFWSEPALPAGWHGIFSSTEMPGTLVVVHD